MCATIPGAHMRFIVLKFILKFGCDKQSDQVGPTIDLVGREFLEPSASDVREKKW